MFKRIAGTFSNKLVATFVSFLIVVLSSRYLGASGKGQISLFIANIVMVQHIGNLVSGGSLVYLTPRMKPIILLIPSYIWSVLSSFLVVGILYVSNLVLKEFVIDLIILSTLNNLVTTNYMILLGKEQVKKYNGLTLLYAIITFLYLVYSFLIINNREVSKYIEALYISYSVVLVLSFVYLRKEFIWVRFSEFKEAINRIVKLGFTAQFSNIISFINYRFSYYVLVAKFSDSVLGVYSIGVALSEALWLMSKSIALIQYTKIVNEEDKKVSQQLTFSMAKVSFWITLIMLIGLSIVPEPFFRFVFGWEFGDAKQVIYALGFGVLSISISTTFAHYFGGIARYDINNKASIVGLIVTLSLTHILIDYFGMIGAGVSTSLAYLASGVYQYFMFRKESGFQLSMLFPNKSDLQKVKNLIS